MSRSGSGEGDRRDDRTVEGVSAGNAFPVALEALGGKPPRRIGFVSGGASIPADFDALGRDEIEAVFGAGEAP